MEEHNPYGKRNILIPSILIGIIGISILSSIILYSVQVQQSAELRESLEQRAEEEVSANTFHVSQIAGLQISSVMQTTELLSGAPVILGNGNEIPQLLQSSLASSEIIDSFFIFDENSVLTHATSTDQAIRSQIGNSFPDHPSFVNPRDSNETFVSHLIIGIDGSSYTMHVSSPIIDPETQEFLGVVIASIHGETLANTIEDAVQLGGDTLALTDAAGNIVYSSGDDDDDASLIGINILSEEVLNQLPESIRTDFRDSLINAVRGNSGVLVIDFTENPELQTDDAGADIAMIGYSPVIVEERIAMISLLVASEDIEGAVAQNENTNFILFGFVYSVLASMAGFAAAIILINRRLTKRVIETTKALEESNEDLKESTEKLRQQAKELQEIDVAKEEFAAMISHELKTPLTPIEGYLDLLQRGRLGELTEQQQKVVKIMYDNSQRLLRLIQDILDVRKIEVGKLRLNMTEVSSRDIVDQCLSTHQTTATIKSITLVDGTQDMKFRCDGGRIIQVLNNLVGNSIKFVPSGGKIEVNAVSDNGSIVFSVKDNGVGIPKEKQKDLFKKFYQVDTSLSRKSGGSGLGLAICKGIVEAHGGKIWIESEENVGTTVHFSIPKEGQA